MEWMENRSCVHFGIPPLDLKCYEGSFCFIFVVPSPKCAPAHSFVLSKYLLNECVTECNKWCSSGCFTWAPDMFIMLSNLIIYSADFDFFYFWCSWFKWEMRAISHCIRDKLSSAKFSFFFVNHAIPSNRKLVTWY